MPARQLRQRSVTAAALGLALLWGGLLAVRHLEGRASVLDRLESLLLDLRFLVAGPRAPPDGVVLVAIDDDAVREAGSFPLPRPTLARLIAVIAQQQPRALGLDILFLEPGSPAGDEALAEAIRAVPTVLAAVALFEREPELASGSELPRASGRLWPIERFSAIAGVGVVNVSTDQTGTPRHVPLLVRLEGGVVPSFALRLATAAARESPALEANAVTLGGRRIDTDLGLNLPLNFYGPRGSVPTVSAARVLRGNISGDLFTGRTVIVGATAIGSGDAFPNPFDPVVPGLEILGTAVTHLLAGDGLVRSRSVRWLDAAAALALPVLAVLAMAARRTGVGLMLIGLAVAAWLGLGLILFERGIWLNLATPLAAVLPAAGLYGAVRLWLDRRTAANLAATGETFRRFHAPRLAEHLARHPDFLAEPVRQDAAVLFIDLTGFTGLSERLGPSPTREILKRFHSLVEAEADREGGVVVAFMGDGAMILFGLPEPEPDDAVRAVRAALALCRTVETFTAELKGVLGRIGVRIGAHWGPVVASRLGPDSHQHITATGDTVNVASRLLEVSAQAKAAIVLSAALVEAAGTDALVLESGQLDPPLEVFLRGRDRPLAVHLWRPGPGDAAARPPAA
jgi:adenylate cyclase